MRLARNSLIAFIGVLMSAAVLPAAALAATPPVIQSTWVSGVSQNDATLDAVINPEDASVGAYYQFQVVASASELLPEIACPPEADWRPLDGCDGTLTPSALPIGFIDHGTEGRSVSLDLAAAGASLQPDTTYHYRVLAARKVTTEDTLQWEGPAVAGPEQTFTTLATGPAPAVEGESVSHLTPTDATLEAQIDTEGLPATYQFDLWSSPCSKHGSGCELMREIHLPSGLLLGSFVDQSVSLDLNSVGVTLGEGEYGYSVTATSTAGSTHGSWQVFEAPPGVLDPPSGDSATPQSASSQSTVLGGGDQGAGAGQGSSAPPSAPRPLGTAAKASQPKRSHKHKAKAKGHRRKAARRRARAKPHKP
jgi:hypothetical protein